MNTVAMLFFLALTVAGGALLGWVARWLALGGESDGAAAMSHGAAPADPARVGGAYGALHADPETPTAPPIQTRIEAGRAADLEARIDALQAENARLAQGPAPAADAAALSRKIAEEAARRPPALLSISAPAVVREIVPVKPAPSAEAAMMGESATGETAAGPDEENAEILGLRAELDAAREEARRLRQRLWSEPSASEDQRAAAVEADDSDAQGPEAALGEVEIPQALDPREIEASRMIEEGLGVEELPPPRGLRPGGSRAPDADDLKLIRGVGPALETRLNLEGVYRYDQIAQFSGADLAWLDSRMGFRGRVVRDRWIPQAEELARRKAAGEPLRASAQGGTTPPAPAEKEPSALELEALRLLEAGDFVADESNRPALLLDSASEGEPDDLKEIKGVAFKLEDLLNSLGIYYFRQIAQLSARDVAWLDTKLKFRGRIVRDRWISQAAALHRVKYGRPASGER